ncbi:MAG: hypothetical protein QOG53_1015 [Frankiales bacterium]|jgi:hypothetical protein|nr:hypothetical protein [Frankiales bacterium]
MTSESVATPARAPRIAFAALLLSGSAVAVALGVYAHEHTPAGRPIFTLGFSGMLQMKAWLSTAGLAFVVVQLLTALWMYGRFGGTAPRWVAPVHRWSGTIAFVVLLPVAFHCMWALGFGTGSTRVYVHSIVGCALYGAFAAKMLALRIRGLPAWTVPLLGGLVLTSVVVLWLTAALWFFNQSGVPLT